MGREYTQKQIHFYLTYLLAFCIPLYGKALPILIVLLAVNWIWHFPNIKRSVNVVKRSPALLAMMVFYLLNVIGLIHTTNFRFANEELETKLSFLILPLIFASTADESRSRLHHYLKMYVFGCIAYALICMSHAIYAYFKPLYIVIDGQSYNFGASYFYYTYLSVFFHPSYTALYTTIAFYIIYYLYKRESIRWNAGWTFVMIFLSVFILLLSSKAGWISFAFVFGMIAIDLLRNRNWKPVALSCLFLVSTFFFLNILYAPPFAQRIPKMESIENSIKGKDDQNNVVASGSEGTARRIFVWKASWKVVQEHWLTGTGTGDSKDELMKKYLELNMKSEYENKLNSHNQFFTIMIAFGIGGLLVFLWCLYAPIKMSFAHKDLLLLVVPVLIGLNCLFESIFERQDGVIIYAFLHSLLCSRIRSGNNDV